MDWLEAQELARTRQVAGLSIAELARRSSYRPQTVWQWEHGRGRIPREAARRFLRVCKEAIAERQAFRKDLAGVLSEAHR